MPRRTPGNVVLFLPLDKAHIPIDNGSAPELRPPLRLGGFANAGGAQEQNAPALVLYSGGMKLDHLPAHGVGVGKKFETNQ